MKADKSIDQNAAESSSNASEPTPSVSEPTSSVEKTDGGPLKCLGKISKRVWVRISEWLRKTWISIRQVKISERFRKIWISIRQVKISKRFCKILMAAALGLSLALGSAGDRSRAKPAVVISSGYVEVSLEFVPKAPQILSGLDFEALAAGETNAALKSMHEYFAGLSPTFENEYTGLFEGYNLIQIVAESFSPYVLTLEPELFPNLNRLYNEGFQFTNFYTPFFYQGTSDGEYVTLQNLIPIGGDWRTSGNAMTLSSKNYLPQTTANQLANEGYTIINAYHNWSYQFYLRNLTHPNLGYNFKAMGKGLNVSYAWPTSDLEMMKLSVPEYVNSGESFYVYYLTMSGHYEYNWDGNRMSEKHRNEVKHLPYDDAVKAYLACQIELDLAVGYLLDELEKAGIADRTLISLSSDHYPYGLENDGANAMTRLAGRYVDPYFEYYQNSWLLWSGRMTEPVVVDTLACSMDILPTLNNLLGIEWDSRLLMGRDVFSDAERLVVFGSHNWITELGRYQASTRKFTPNEGVTVPDDYVATITARVEQQFKISSQILSSDYFRLIFKKSGLI